MSDPGSPTVRRRRLAAELRKIRERCGESLEVVAAALHWSTSKLSRYELGKGGLKPAEVANLLTHYAISGPYREHLLALAKDAAQRAWWEEYSDVSTAEFQQFIGLEAEASSIEIWHSEVVTGLLQTERYARAILSDYSQVERTAPAIIERRLDLRMRRREILSRTTHLELHVVLDESVLMRQVGDSYTMFEQLQHLAAEADRPNITLRVRPLGVKHSVFADSFVIFRFGPDGDAILHDVVATEGLRAAFYVEGEQETFLHRVVFNMLRDESLDVAESKKLILQTADSLWRAP
jgi:transcriptional regulator with XRE-family HTH domain